MYLASIFTIQYTRSMCFVNVQSVSCFDLKVYSVEPDGCFGYPTILLHPHALGSLTRRYHSQECSFTDE